MPRSRQKFYGQNFLTSRDVIQDLVSAIDPRSDERIFEIGPGRGALTIPLGRKSKVCCLETDRRLIVELQLAVERERLDSIKILEGDVLEFDFNEIFGHLKPPVRVVSNLPYHSAKYIYLRLNEFEAKCPGKIRDMTLMFQREVGERLCGEPGRRGYGFLSVITKIYYDARKVMIVDRGAFRPSPKVQSMVVHFQPLKRPRIQIADRSGFLDYLWRLFNYRRKTLANSLASGFGPIITKEAAIVVLGGIDIDPASRPELLSLEKIERLYHELKNKGLCNGKARSSLSGAEGSD